MTLLGKDASASGQSSLRPMWTAHVGHYCPPRLPVLSQLVVLLFPVISEGWSPYVEDLPSTCQVVEEIEGSEQTDKTAIW